MTKNNQAATVIIAALVSLLLAACSGRPSGVLGKEDMAQLLADIHIGESAIAANSRQFPTDSAKRAFLQSIYMKHGVTREEVDSSMSWYGYNMDKYMEVYDRTVEILEERLEKAQDLAGSSAEGLTEVSTELEGDSVDVWPGIRTRRFATTMPNEIITFSLNSDRNWEKGDVYTLRTKIIDNHAPLYYSIAVDYSDGQREYISRTLNGDGWHDMQFVLDSARTAQRVYGAISYQPRQGETVFIDSISLMRTRWGGHYRDGRQMVKPFANRTQSSSSHRPALVPVQEQAPAQPLERAPLKPGERLQLSGNKPLPVTQR